MILLGLGSNLGDRKANLEAALAALALADVHILRVSSVYETDALLPEDAPAEWDIPYYNIVAAAESALQPEALLEAAKRVERQLGRKDVGRWGPRVIDIDILAHGGAVMQGENLTIPHPRTLDRDFVMVPLAEIAPHWQYPGEGISAHEWVAQRGMTIGQGLMRLSLALQWRVTEE